MRRAHIDAPGRTVAHPGVSVQNLEAAGIEPAPKIGVSRDQPGKWLSGEDSQKATVTATALSTAKLAAGVQRGQVFTDAARLACEDKGHCWRRVRTWHAVGWDECSTCGQAQLAAEVPASVEGERVATPEPVAPPSPPGPDSEAPRYEGATAPGAKERYRRRHAERDAEIRRLAAAGTNQREIARTFGIHQPRVCQIVREDNAAVVAAGES